MRSLASLCSCVTLFALPAVAGAQTVGEIFEQMSEKEIAGLQDIDSLLLRTETMGMSQLEYFEKTAAVNVNGETMYVLNRVPPQEIARRQSPSNALSDASPAELRAAAAALEEQGVRMEAEVQREMQQTGLPGGIGTMLMNPPPDQPWLSANPNDMMGMYATMLRASADASEAEAAVDPGAEQRDRANDMALIAARTELMGRTTIEG